MHPLATRWLGGACSLILFSSIAALTPAEAKRTQAQLTPTFKDRGTPSPDAKPAEEPACAVRFEGITDERTSPEIVGVIGNRGVLAPHDTRAWLRAVLGGLRTRGIRPLFDDESAAEAGRPVAQFSLKTAWINGTAVTYSGIVMVHVKAANAAGQSVDQTYRGRVSRTAYWSGGNATLQSAMDGAFADVLDAMATDIKPLCGN